MSKHHPKPPMWFRWAALTFGGLCTGMALALLPVAPAAALLAALVAAGAVTLYVQAPAGRRAAA